jgi:hypothetical protein
MQIRERMFETNSSSTHSYVIANKKLKNDIIYEDIDKYIAQTGKRKKVIKIHTGQFGWGYETLNNWQDKASYVATYISEQSEQDKLNMTKEFEEKLSKFLNNPVKIAFEPGSYIDHQSMDFAEKCFENMIEIIFRKGGIIEIANDNG